MSKRWRIADYAKRAFAGLMAFATVATLDFSGLMIHPQQQVAEAATSILSSDERGVIYANSRTDFRDETIYFLITTRFYDGDSSTTNN